MGSGADWSLQAIPEKYSKYKLDPIDEFFAMGRGLQKPQTPEAAAVDVPAMVHIPGYIVTSDQIANAHHRKW